MTLSLGYYPSFEVSSAFDIPDDLKNLLQEVWQRHYVELYEEETETNTSLESSCEEVIEALGDPEDSIVVHRRCVWMAYTLALAVKPTVQAYLPNDPRPQQVLERIKNWLENSAIPSIAEINQLFPQLSVGSQAIDEALYVFRNLLRVTDLQQAREALLEILDCCFEGYAIFPGSDGRRDLFNWWLVEVVPAAWCLRVPNAIYTMEWSWPPAHKSYKE